MLLQVRDESKMTELTDEQLVAACGGRTAHKGGRHGLNMQAKLDRYREVCISMLNAVEISVSLTPEDHWCPALNCFMWTGSSKRNVNLWRNMVERRPRRLSLRKMSR